MSEERHIFREHIGDAPAMERGEIIASAMLLGAPLAFLAAQMLRYVLVGPACEMGSVRVLLEVATLIALLGAAGVGWLGWQRTGRSLDAVSADETAQSRFIGMIALMSGALFLLAGALLWLPSVFLSPCGRP